MIRIRYVAIASLLFTVAFFIEYTPLLRRVHIPFDLEGFHYPLADYAFQSLRQGRFPQWDPTIYSGLSFNGNAQAALFYPPTWLMFVLNWGRAKLSYQTLQDLTLAHVWLAFLLCYLWLLRRRLHPLASAFGAGVFAFSGFMLLQLQHFGLIAGYAWMPLGFAAIDGAVEGRTRRPLWKLVLASALCFLAGYPPMWVVFSVCMLAYACGRKDGLRWAPLAALALAGSLLVAAVQVLPSWEATRVSVQEARYGSDSGVKDPEFFISYFVPNYFDFGLDVPLNTNPGREYLYLGTAGLVGMALLLRSKRLAETGPPIAMLLASLLFLVNPLGLVGRVIEHFSLLAQVFSAWYFLAGVTASVALFAAIGLDYGLQRVSHRAPVWLVVTAAGLSLAWSIRLIASWIPGALAARWLSGVDALIAVILFGLLIFIYPGSSGRLRVVTAVAALLLVASEYKAFGTSKRFNAYRGPYATTFTTQPFPGMNASLYARLRQNPEYRVALDVTALFPQDLRHNGLTTPQGFDPLLPARYKDLVDRVGHFRTNREFDVLPENDAALRLLGVRYFVTSEKGPLYSQLSASPHFHRLEPDDSYHKVFEYDHPQPAFGWEDPDSQSVELKDWRPERRSFVIRSTSAGRFRLTEQFFPGWTATVDGKETAIERCHDAFQCVAVGPGEHRVEFSYHSRWLVVGAMVSIGSLLLSQLALRFRFVR